MKPASIISLACGLLLLTPVHADEAATTRGVINPEKLTERPDDATQLLGDEGHQFVSDNGKPTKWKFEDGVLTVVPGSKSVVTPDDYQDFRMHLEFNVNDNKKAIRAQGNGNSGVYIQKRYELQILNSHGTPEKKYKSNDCGSLYKLKKPDHIACKPAGEWQTYDIVFRAARFKDGNKTENARITVYHNGKLIHDDYSIPRKTGLGKKEGPAAGPILLQDHGNPVRFRNIWIQEISL